MGWFAYLSIDNLHWEGHARDWCYTHNTSGMIRDALQRAGEPLDENVSWWKLLDGMSGAAGHRYLSVIVEYLTADPERYIVMNPPNQWGDYEGLVKELTEMRDACQSEIPMTWEASG